MFIDIVCLVARVKNSEIERCHIAEERALSSILTPYYTFWTSSIARVWSCGVHQFCEDLPVSEYT